MGVRRWSGLVEAAGEGLVGEGTAALHKQKFLCRRKFSLKKLQKSRKMKRGGQIAPPPHTRRVSDVPVQPWSLMERAV